MPRPAAIGPNDLWSLDVVNDQLSDGRRFRCLTLIDSCTRECLAITAAHSLPGLAVISTLESVIAAQFIQPSKLVVIGSVLAFAAELFAMDTIFP